MQSWKLSCIETRQVNYRVLWELWCLRCSCIHHYSLSPSIWTAWAVSLQALYEENTTTRHSYLRPAQGLFCHSLIPISHHTNIRFTHKHTNCNGLMCDTLKGFVVSVRWIQANTKLKEIDLKWVSGNRGKWKWNGRKKFAKWAKEYFSQWDKLFMALFKMIPTKKHWK